MTARVRLLPAVLFLLALLASSVLTVGASRTLQQTVTPTPTEEDGPARVKILIVDLTASEWWISRWTTNQVLCSLVIEHEGLPFGDEILTLCGQVVYNEWAATPPCAMLGGSVRECTGVYLHQVASWPKQRKIKIDLPPATAWVSITGCEPAPPSNKCSVLPRLRITGEEPLPNETIISVHGFLGSEPFTCMGGICEVPLPATGNQGIRVEFWVDSSFGDSSERFIALVRAVPWGDFVAPEGQTSDAPLWYVDVISTQWRGAPPASCSQIWESFPALGGPPGWLTTPERPEQLASEEPFYYLAGSLIQEGAVNARACPNGGLQGPGVANVCGMELARPAVVEWQNRFDAELIRVGKLTGVPAQLMKNIFSRESQFWPGIFRTFREAGLGQLTENGADTVLLWNPSFYNQFCPLIFEKEVCRQGFTFLDEPERNILKGALVSKVNSACPDCPAGIDLSQANFSINVFAEGLLANCNQAGQIVYNAASRAAGLSSSYVDLWRFTLVNYNAGPGCLEEAVEEAYQAGLTLNWINVSSRLDEACQGAIGYVDDITTINPLPAAAVPAVQFTPAATLAATPGPSPTPTIRPTATATPGPTTTATVTPDPNATPYP